MTIDLSNKVALVTGGARDIGRAISLKLADAGASVVVNYNASGDQANAVVKEITDRGGTALAVRADVTKRGDVAELVQRTSDAFGGRIDILVNNAGGLVGRKSFADMDEAFWDRVMDLNLKSVYFVTRAAIPLLSDGASVVMMSSLAARDGGGAGGHVYAAAKGAVLTLTRGLSKELAAKRVRVNAVSPGMINTTFHDLHTKPEARKATAARTSIGREGAAEEVANAVLFLASDLSSYITGESIEINGGVYFV
jgi:3-oxoacyl-[acyl-carrier protein] reductase